MVDYTLVLHEVIAISAALIVEPTVIAFPLLDLHPPHFIELLWVVEIYAGFNILRVVQEYYILPWLPPNYQKATSIIFRHLRQFNPFFRLAYRVGQLSPNYTF